MDKSTKDDIKRKIQKLVESGEVRNEDKLRDFELDKIGDIANKLDICPRDLVIYLTCGGDCNNCTKEYKCI